MKQKFINRICEDEGKRNKIYICPAGKLTAGFGRNMEDKGLSDEECLYLLNNDIAEAIGQLSKFKWFTLLNEDRQAVLVNMVINMGFAGFRKFKNLISCLEKADYLGASLEMKNSKWAEQVGKRAERLARAMELGILD